MSYAAFEASLANETPPTDLPPLLAALWFDRKGDFDRAHSIAQDASGADGALIHAYLHRKEGDHSNAQYWYRRAGADMPRDGLDAEWERLVRRLL